MTFKLLPVNLYSITDNTHPSNSRKQENIIITVIHKHKEINGEEKLAINIISNGILKCIILINKQAKSNGIPDRFIDSTFLSTI